MPGARFSRWVMAVLAAVVILSLLVGLLPSRGI